jgi:hypothetical protein
LQDTYSDREFGICLRFPTALDDPSGFRKPTVLRRIP